MKVNTKTMTPLNKIIAADTMKSVPDSCLFNPNKFIKDGATALNKATGEDDDTTSFGTFIRYIPTIFYTPVKSSSRLESKGTLSADGVKDLSKAFEQLLINTNVKDEDEEKTETTEEEEKTAEDTETKIEVEDNHNDESEEKLGRFHTRDTTHKSAPKKVDVLRSYRLVSDEE